MSEERTNQVSAQEKLARMMKSIGVDLWGGAGQEAADAPDQETEIAVSEGGREIRKTISDNLRKIPVAIREKPGLSNLWMTADETVDWTDALLRDTPPDGLTDPKLWRFYHRMAPRVLAGETDAYAEVLTTINPLGDLARYVAGMILRTPGPDRLECVFECQSDDLEKYGRSYLGALSLRIARDLLAILPVSEVHITGKLGDEEKVDVTFRRDQLLKQKMAFLVPADFVEACGGKI